MDPILLTALGVGGVLFSGYMFSRSRFLSWQRMATQCAEQSHLQGVTVYGRVWKWELQGQAGPLMVRIASTRPDRDRSQVVIVIPGPPDFSEVSIRRESQTPWKTREIEIGSEAFDHTFFITGPIKFLHALLDAETRGLLIRTNDALTIVGSRLEISGGKLLAETVDRQLSSILPLLLRAGEWFAQPVDLKERLAHNATRDPEAGVRLNNLLLLARELPGDEKTLQVLRDAAYSDRIPGVRLRAARALGAEGRGVLLKLAENLENDDVSAEAVSILDRELPPLENKQVILLRALSNGSLQTARACLEALGREGSASAVNLLVEVLEQQEGAVAVFAIRALAATGSPAAEGPLIRALQRSQMDLWIAAAHALGRVGSTAAVLPLKQTAERFSSDPELSQATRQAIAEIQSRLPGATPGQLSLAGAEAGQLSLAQAEAGQLSLATDPAGQLSLSGADGADDETPGEA